MAYRIENGTMISLGSFKCSDTSILQLRDPQGRLMRQKTDELDENGDDIYKYITFTLLRLDSKEAQKFQQHKLNARIKHAKNTGRLTATAESLREDATDLLVHCTRGWDNLVIEPDEDFDCTAARARWLYTNEEFSWVRSQVDAFINDDTEFLGNSSAG